MNALEINCKGIGSTVYYGPGAGPSPTASAVLADLVDVSKGSLACPELNKESNVYSKEDKKVFARYFRLLVKDEPGVIAKISSLFAENNCINDPSHVLTNCFTSLKFLIMVSVISSS